MLWLDEPDLSMSIICEDNEAAISYFIITSV